jgi:hypothetical protein
MAAETTHRHDGPSLATYVETRFNLLTEATKDALAAADLRYQQRFEAQKTALDAARVADKEMVTASLASADRAVLKAEAASERRFESVNEFRATLTDQQRTFIPRAEVEVLIRALSDKVSSLESRQDRYDNQRRGAVGGWGYAVGAIGFVLMIAAALRTWLP